MNNEQTKVISINQRTYTTKIMNRKAKNLDDLLKNKLLVWKLNLKFKVRQEKIKAGNIQRDCRRKFPWVIKRLKSLVCESSSYTKLEEIKVNI